MQDSVTVYSFVFKTDSVLDLVCPNYYSVWVHLESAFYLETLSLLSWLNSIQTWSISRSPEKETTEKNTERTSSTYEDLFRLSLLFTSQENPTVLRSKSWNVEKGCSNKIARDATTTCDSTVRDNATFKYVPYAVRVPLARFAHSVAACSPSLYKAIVLLPSRDDVWGSSWPHKTDSMVVIGDVRALNLRTSTIIYVIYY